jgi:hypothetical protein
MLMAEHGRDLLRDHHPPGHTGTFRAVKELTTAIGAFIDAYNERCQPFTRTKDADQILARATRPAARALGGEARREPKAVRREGRARWGDHHEVCPRSAPMTCSPS